MSKKSKSQGKSPSGVSAVANNPGSGPSQVKRSRAKNKIHTSHSASWHRRFEELRNFYRKHTHSDVPSPFPENPGLSRWVKRQRWEYALYSAGDTSARAMTPDRIVRLMTVNFTWNLHERSWEKAYCGLLVFKEENGHTNVPSDFQDCHLAQWVGHQRLQIRKYYGGSEKTHITPERVQRLHDIGFSCNTAASVANNLKEHRSIYPKMKTVNIPAYNSPDSQPAGVFYFEEEHLDEANISKGEEDSTTSSKRNKKILRVSEKVNITLLEDNDAEEELVLEFQEDKKKLYQEEKGEPFLPTAASAVDDDGDDDDSSLF
jgi:hypothetical protein